MAQKRQTSKTRRRVSSLLSILILTILILGAFGILDLVSLDDTLEAFLGVRIFMTEPRPVVEMPVSEVSANGDWWSVYFTTSGSESNHIETELITLIDSAESSIHIASFEFDLEEVAEALIAASESGVVVQWVTDDEHGLEADEDEGLGLFELMEEAGVEVIDDQRGALMHNKFWIFDQGTVWTGSTNITHNGTLRNNNNVVVIKSPALAAIYEREFQEMWEEKAFGPKSPSTVQQQNVVIDGTAISVRFGPEDDVGTLLAAMLGKAQSQIRFMAFSFTHDEMGAAILSRAQAGVDVAGIFEERGSETEHSELGNLYCAGVPVLQDGNPRIMHHKVLIIDKQTVVTGSFNFSRNADESNDENVIIIQNAEIAEEYLKEFERRWAEALTDSEPIDVSCQ